MEYRRVGRTGLKVSQFCLGTMTFGHGADKTESVQLVDRALAAGVNFFDCANSYGGGLSEEYLGLALEGRRRDAVVATKFFNPMGTGPNDSGMSRNHIMNAVEDSLRRLRTDWIDLYYIHHVDVQTPLEEMLRAFDDLVRQGKVRYPACSNYPAWRLMDALWTSDHHDWSRFECYQPQYSLVVRDIEQELIPLCQHKGLGVVVWAPLAGGFLSGKYQPGERITSGSRSAEGWAYPQAYFAAHADQTLTVLHEVAADLGRSPAQVAIGWVLAQPQITAAIVGARTLAQLEDNLGAAHEPLPEAAMARLTEVSQLSDRYPEAMQKMMRARRNAAVKMPRLD